MPDRPKRVAAIHDLSGFGRCSLSVILPTLSVMGVQVCPVPTTVFSTHTGGLGSVEQRDLSDFTLPCLEHYRRLGLEFECVYSGFLSSQEQIDHCLKFFSTYQDALAVVDPVMGDHGRPYRTITPQMRSRLGELVRVADIITPNLTEAALLLEEDYADLPRDEEGLRAWLERLSLDGRRSVVLTGVSFDDDRLGAMSYDRTTGRYFAYYNEKVHAGFHGTGDIFTATVLGAMMQGRTLEQAVTLAVDFTLECIRCTCADPAASWYGVEFEKALPWLARQNNAGAE